MHAWLAAVPEYTQFKATFVQDITARRFKDSVKAYWIKRFHAFDAAAYRAALNDATVGWIIHGQPDYPAWLSEIADPPLILYYKGCRETLKHRLFAVVGTRKPSVYGVKVTRDLCAGLLPVFTLVSGLADGIDHHVHQQSVQLNAPTIGVLAIGLDGMYPKKNAALAAAMLDHQGVWLSEQPLGVGPMAFRFPQRNRLISGLSEGVLVTEAGRYSGASITAHQAIEQNRNVYAVPGPITAPTSIGTHQLIQEGAKLVHHVADILSDYDIVTPSQDEPDILSGDEARILSCIGTQACSVDQLCAITGMPIATLLHYISLLELKGCVAKTQTGQYTRV